MGSLATVIRHLDIHRVRVTPIDNSEVTVEVIYPKETYISYLLPVELTDLFSLYLNIEVIPNTL